MTATFLPVLGALTLATVISYLGGRVHQWRREDDRRRVAFRAGFLRASTTVTAVPNSPLSSRVAGGS
ncbi:MULTISPECIES: hypothetical protein [Actinoplanes]|uniref:Uncharacterized protein n=2 Tax=Actinoplanes TaxID=1865 RepID=A0A0X3V0A5_9ACTN|nr:MULTISPECIES: hypothetical protein [Actinoplanes]KUL36686.1 hypothetical protein ADL15_12685 [Actinoplanes awajinensis subsp. mycoplanecinus]